MEAGGKITDMKGKELSFTGSSSALAVSEGIAAGREEYLL
jgi:3'-phosphoadenosine 5'-phosphosulfate (PAPS) 3'-phosphatase